MTVETRMWGGRAWRLLWVVFACFVGAQSAKGITIFLDNTNDDEQEWPAWDPGGNILEAHFNAARDIWESVLPSGVNPPATYSIEFHWDDDISGLALTTDFGPCCDILIEINPNPNPNINWFVDPTPSDNVEFNFTAGQTLYRDLTSSQQSDWFPGTAPPGTLEVGNFGTAINATCPGSSSTSACVGASGTASTAGFDLLRSITHEMGHALGINGAEPGEYNIYPHHVGGLSNVLVKEEENSDIGESHLAGGTAAFWLMCEGCAPVGQRVLPSATDILVIAEDQGLPVVELERVGRISSGSWHSGSGWIGGEVPGSSQHVAVRHGSGTVTLGGPATVRTLAISEGTSAVRTSNHLLRVLEGPTRVTTRLIVDTGGEARLVGLDLAGGRLTMQGGLAMIQGGIEMDGSAMITGRGTVRAFNTINNNGLIRADGGTLRFQWASFAPNILDLDGEEVMGVEPGVVEAIDGDLSFEAGLTEAFDGVMTVGAGRTATFASGWDLGFDGVLRFDTGNTTTFATVDGLSSNLFGDVFVTGVGVFASPTTFQAGSRADITLPTARLRLAGFTTYAGGQFVGNGTLEQRGDAQVTQSTDIDVKSFDWDGGFENSTTTIQSGQRFTINSQTIDMSNDVPDGYDARSFVNGADLIVNTNRFDAALGQNVPDPWMLDAPGEIHLVNSKLNTNPPTFSGAKLGGSPVLVAGRLAGHGEDNRVEADVTFLASAQVQATNVISELYLVGATEYRGGSHTGEGTIHQYGNAVVSAMTTIGVATFNWDGDDSAPSTTNVAPGATLWLRSQRIEVADPRAGFDGVLNVDQGRAIVNTGYFVFPNLDFFPWILDTNGTINLNGSAILSGTANPVQISAPGSPVAVRGTINATGVDNVIYSIAAFGPTARVQVNADSRLVLGAATTFAGGTYQGPGTLVQDAPAVVSAATTFDVATFDLDGTTAAGTVWTLENLGRVGPPDVLTFNVQQIDEMDHSFNGTINVKTSFGLAVNVPTPEWVMDGLIDVIPPPSNPIALDVFGSPVRVKGVVNVLPTGTATFHNDVSGPGAFTGGGTVVFLGAYNPGASPGIGHFAGDVEFGPAATLNIEIGGTLGGRQFDLLDVAGNAELAGTLAVSLVDGFRPRLGDEFALVGAVRTSGTFQRLVLPALEPGLEWSLDYRGRSVTLVVATTPGTIAGDMNLDGRVDRLDTGLFMSHLGADEGSIWTTGDFDGDGATTLRDLGMLQANLGMAGPSPAAQRAAVPEPGWFWLVGGALLGLLISARRRRRAE
jgi:hypothetical protein